MKFVFHPRASYIPIYFVINWRKSHALCAYCCLFLFSAPFCVYKIFNSLYVQLVCVKCGVSNVSFSTWFRIVRQIIVAYDLRQHTTQLDQYVYSWDAHYSQAWHISNEIEISVRYSWRAFCNVWECFFVHCILYLITKLTSIEWAVLMNCFTSHFIRHTNDFSYHNRWLLNS